MAQETSNDIPWAFYLFGLPSSDHLLLSPIISLFHCCSVWSGGSVAILSLFCSCRHSLYEQLLMVALGGPSMVLQVAAVVVLLFFHCYKSKPIKYKLVEGKKI